MKQANSITIEYVIIKLKMQHEDRYQVTRFRKEIVTPVNCDFNHRVFEIDSNKKKIQWPI